MVLRSGKYKGWTVQSVQYSDPSYLVWVRGNRPEMLIERKAKPKVEVPEEELEERNTYKNLPKLTWKEAFPTN